MQETLLINEDQEIEDEDQEIEHARQPPPVYRGRILFALEFMKDYILYHELVPGYPVESLGIFTEKKNCRATAIAIF